VQCIFRRRIECIGANIGQQRSMTAACTSQ
jgi:hypothetical protein